MAESSVLITWGRSETGREMMGLNVFKEALGYFEKQKNAGNIEEFKVGLTEVGNLGGAAGYMIAEGTNDQVRKIFDDQNFKTLVIKATHVVSNMEVQRCATGTAIPNRIEKIVEVRSGLGIK